MLDTWAEPAREDGSRRCDLRTGGCVGARGLFERVCRGFTGPVGDCLCKIWFAYHARKLLGNPTLSPRPAELKINDVDPCSLFPADRRAEFGVNQPPLGPTPKGNMTGCSFSSPTGGVGIYADPGHDAAYFLGDTLSNIGTEISVGGYPAVSGYPKTRKDSVCFIEIDVAEGQNLSVQYDDRAKRGPDALCPIAQKVALVALDALKAQKK